MTWLDTRLTLFSRAIMTPRSLAIAVALSIFTLACGPEATDTRIGVPHDPRPDSCDLTVVNGSDPATFAKYDQVGLVRLSNAPAGTDPFDPSVKEIVRPRACQMGGEAISVMASGEATSRNGLRETAYAAFVVWAKKSAPQATPQKF